ncbi:hypothetical protein C9426_24110 [Serratia sp. S1B]|nr:hypothetical protein C9426_24110 [Serratia sp. S1B]
MNLKDNKFIVSVLFKKSKWALYVAVLVILSVLFGTVNGYNYISALANIVIAASAVMAYLTARNYLPQLTTQEGYKIAIQMVNNELQSTTDIDDAVQAAKKLDVTLVNLDGKRADGMSNKKLCDELDIFNKLLGKAKEYEKKINAYISTMKTYGLEPAPDRKVAFEAFRNDINVINTTLIDIKMTLQNYKNSHTNKIVTISNEQSYYPFKYVDEKQDYEKMKNALSILNTEHNLLRSNRLSFFGEKKQIGKLFVVNLD